METIDAIDMLEAECLSKSLLYEQRVAGTEKDIFETLRASSDARREASKLRYKSLSMRGIPRRRKRKNDDVRLRSQRLLPKSTAPPRKTSPRPLPSNSNTRHGQMKRRTASVKRKQNRVKQRTKLVEDDFVCDLPAVLSPAGMATSLKDLARQNVIEMDTNFPELKPVHFEFRPYPRLHRGCIKKHRYHPQSWRESRNEWNLQTIARAKASVLNARKYPHDGGGDGLWKKERDPRCADEFFYTNYITGEIRWRGEWDLKRPDGDDGS